MELVTKVTIKFSIGDKLAVEITTLLFNCWMKSTYNSIFIDAGITVSENMLLQWEDMDNKKTKTMEAKTGNKSKRKTLKQRNIKQQQAFVHS